MQFINTHSHVYSNEFNRDREEVLQRAVNAGIIHIILPDIDAAHRAAMRAVCKEHPSLCLPLVGIHPTSVNEHYKTEIAEFDKTVASEKPIGIGEIGIDLYWDTTFKNEQREVFLHQMHYALSHDLPVVIHVRNAFDEIFEILESLEALCQVRHDFVSPPKFKGVFHCFSGNYEQAQVAIAMGFYIGVGGVITYKNSGLDKLVSQLPLERILLETDDPWLTPRPCKAKRNEPAFLLTVAEKVAECKNLPLSEVARITTANAMNLFQL
ncbi:MAG: TatD family hydrolase [Bacteroidales bacterium]|jgi:TatD DNase family protein|nr:TatD family hydrolase [Bacteroidales bacterium]